MRDAIMTTGNPFMATSHELLTLDTHDCVDAMVGHALHTMETLGKEKYCKYVKDVLIEPEPIHKTIKKKINSHFSSGPTPLP